MSFAITATAEPRCDICQIDSEPCELRPDANGKYGLEGAIAEMRSEGWLCDDQGNEMACPDCVMEMEAGFK